MQPASSYCGPGECSPDQPIDRTPPLRGGILHENSRTTPIGRRVYAAGVVWISASTKVVRRTQSPSADVATSITSNPAARRRSAAAERTRAFSPTIKTTGFSITTMTRVDVPGDRRNTLHHIDYTRCTSVPGRRMSRGLVYENQARRLIGRNVPLLAPSCKGGGTDPDPGDAETGPLKLPLDPLCTLKPGIVCRRQFIGVAEQLQ